VMKAPLARGLDFFRRYPFLYQDKNG